MPLINKNIKHQLSLDQITSISQCVEQKRSGEGYIVILNMVILVGSLNAF